MKSIIGSALALAFKLPAVRRWLKRDLYGHLRDVQGNLYMGRYAVIRTGTRLSKALAFVTRGKYDHLRLHWIRRPDRDREEHNHPFNYRTFIVQGWYEEQRSGDRGLRTYFAGDSGGMDTTGYHRIAAVSEGGVWTLFFMGPDNGEWGFLVDGKHVTSREFFKLRHIAADGTGINKAEGEFNPLAHEGMK